MLVGEVPGGGGQVVGVDGGQGQAPVGGRLQRPAVVLLLEPQHRGAEHAAAGEVVARPGLDGAQVLADDDGAGAMGLEQGDADHGLVVVADVGALVRPHAPGDPPQAEQPDDVVHAQRTGVAQHRAHHVAQRRVGGLRQVGGAPRRLGPVLAELVVHVRRGADLDARGEGVRVAPHVGPVGVDADGQVVHDPQAHARGPGLGLRTAQLLVDDPLQPRVEVDALGQGAGLVGDEGARGVPEGVGPVLELAVLLGQGAPQGVPLQVRALLGAEALEVPLAGPGATGREDDLEGLALGLPDGVAVNGIRTEVGRRDLLEGPLDQGAAGPGQAGDLPDRLGADVDRVDEAPGHRQVGRRRHAAGGLRGVQRVDQEEVGALVPQEAHQLGEVVGVADPP